MENNNNKDMPDEIWAGINISGKKWNEGDCFESPMAPPLAHAKYTRTDTIADTIAEKDRVLELMAEALNTIANEDYRGNRPHSAAVAYKALAEYAEMKE